MSRRFFAPIVSVLAAAALLAGGAVGLVRAQSTSTSLANGFPEIEAPALLGPITETGRTGWACKPEIAAAARAAKSAELPVAPR